MRSPQPPAPALPPAAHRQPSRSAASLAAWTFAAALVARSATAQAQAPTTPGTARPAAEAPASVPPARPFLKLRVEADAAREAGRLPEARTLYRRALQLQPTWVEGHWYLGTIAYELSDFATCRTALTQVVRRQADNGAAWAFKGLCEFNLKAYTPALDDVTKALKLGVGDDPEFLAVVGYHRTILLIRAGQFERALEECSNFVRGGNTGPTIVEALGLALLRMPVLPANVPADKKEMVQLAGQASIYSSGRMVEAADQAFRQLRERYPTAPNVHYLYGMYLAHEHPDEALEQFKAELRVSPDHALAMVQIAQELVKRGDEEGAAPWATNAVRLAPGNFVARRILGQVKLRAGDTAGAIVELEAAVKLQPDSPSVHFNLAKAYQRAGRPADAERERSEFTRLERQLRVLRGGANAVGEQGEEPAPPTP